MVSKTGTYPWWRSKHWVEQQVIKDAEPDDLMTVKYSNSAKQWYYYIFSKKETVSD
jgi:hypothetical protein